MLQGCHTLQHTVGFAFRYQPMSAWKTLILHSCPGNLPHKTHLCSHRLIDPAADSPHQLCCCLSFLPCSPLAGGPHTRLCQPLLVSTFPFPCSYFHICQDTSDLSCNLSPCDFVKGSLLAKLYMQHLCGADEASPNSPQSRVFGDRAPVPGSTSVIGLKLAMGHPRPFRGMLRYQVHMFPKDFERIRLDFS